MDTLTTTKTLPEVNKDVQGVKRKKTKKPSKRKKGKKD
jgi:hypothetical protein